MSNVEGPPRRRVRVSSIILVALFAEALALFSSDWAERGKSDSDFQSERRARAKAAYKLHKSAQEMAKRHSDSVLGGSADLIVSQTARMKSKALNEQHAGEISRRMMAVNYSIATFTNRPAADKARGYLSTWRIANSIETRDSREGPTLYRVLIEKSDLRNLTTGMRQQLATLEPVIISTE